MPTARWSPCASPRGHEAAAWIPAELSILLIGLSDPQRHRDTPHNQTRAHPSQKAGRQRRDRIHTQSVRERYVTEASCWDTVRREDQWNSSSALMLLVRCRWTIVADALSKMAPDAPDLKPNDLACDDDTLLGQGMFDFSGAERQAIVCPNVVGDNLSGKTEAVERRHQGGGG